jgi:hypothetical protein
MTAGWAAIELQDLDLGDVRRTRRVAQVVETLAAAPHASVPEASGSWAATKATYRLWDNPAVSAAAIRAAHTASTVRSLAGLDTVLVVQDTTELDLTPQPMRTAAGLPERPAPRTLHLHSDLVVSLAGVPLGVVAQQHWQRDPDAPGRQTRRQRATAEKESQRWLTGLTLGEVAIPNSCRVVMVADREADIFDLFAQPRRPGSDWLIRATQDRRVAVAADADADADADAPASLLASIAAAPLAGHTTVTVPRGRGRMERTATLALRYQAVTLRPPRARAAADDLRPVPVWAVLAEEFDAPEGVAPIRWLLLASWPVLTLSAALECVAWYRLRWLIERYHYVLKQGCQVEALRLETPERLERALATYSIVSWRVLWLSLAARQTPDASCEVVLARHEWQALACATQRTATPPAAPPTLRQAVRWIAQLGGFLGRTADGEPGVKVLWRGLQRLTAMTDLWLVLHAPAPEPPDPPRPELVGKG